MAQRYENITFSKALPKNLIWTGLFIIFTALAMLFLVGWFLKYSDKVIGEVVMTTSTMPLEIPAKTDGILDFFIEDEESVHKGTVIALVENNIIPYQEVLKLEEYLKEDLSPLEQAKKIANQEISRLGDLKNSFTAIKESLYIYDNFIQSNQQANLVASKKKSIQLYKTRLSLLEEKGTLTQADIAIAKRQVEGRERLFNRDSISSRIDVESALQEEINKKVVNLNNEEAINTINILIAELEREILESQSQYQENQKTYKNAIQLNLNQLQNDIQEWKNKYLIIANRSGQCIWSEYLTDEQYIQAGKTVCIIVSGEQTQPIAKMEIPMKGASKVSIGQEVNILMDNYPSNEFGILKGEVKKIAPLPENSLLKVDVALPEPLISTYGYPFNFQQLAEGHGEIITNKMSFLERIWNEARGRQLNQ